MFSSCMNLYFRPVDRPQRSVNVSRRRFVEAKRLAKSMFSPLRAASDFLHLSGQLQDQAIGESRISRTCFARASGVKGFSRSGHPRSIEFCSTQASAVYPEGKQNLHLRSCRSERCEKNAPTNARHHHIGNQKGNRPAKVLGISNRFQRQSGTRARRSQSPQARLASIAARVHYPLHDQDGLPLPWTGEVSSRWQTSRSSRTKGK